MGEVNQLLWFGNLLGNEKEPNAEEARSEIRKDMAMKLNICPKVRSERKIRPKDIAVFVRSNPDARKVWQYFWKRGLVTVVFTDVSLFNSVEAKKFLVLRELWMQEMSVQSNGH